MIHHRALFFVVMGCATTASYALTLPSTIAYQEAGFADVHYYTEPAHAPLLIATNISAIPTEKTTNQVSDAKPVSIQKKVPARGVVEADIDSDATTAKKKSKEEAASSVPFYSQFNDISDPSWKNVGCGIASLAMLIDNYKPAVPVDTLLKEGIAAGAYISSAGWSHAGLIALAKKHGLTGQAVGLAQYSMDKAFAKLTTATDVGPVMVSVHYTFEPTNPIPHLVVVTGVIDGMVYYNDPAEPTGGETISAEKFKKAWKKRYIEIREAS